MYNRYIRNDTGRYEPIPPQDTPPPSGPPPPGNPPPGEGPPPPPPGGAAGLIQKLLSRFRLDSIDGGDLILLLIIYLLFKDGEDEELLIALGLLLIL